ncbi:M15 family metallopeptidase [Aquibacillus kalidii]|uniref:M15 family metallopeptidase n=1 Tax=Aquibacillus kalidii TaxID=2762597 RepID=UPI0016440FBF|nr:M15 family metallopeptidase [Aquibacillus kalidii]
MKKFKFITATILILTTITLSACTNNREKANDVQESQKEVTNKELVETNGTDQNKEEPPSDEEANIFKDETNTEPAKEVDQHGTIEESTGLTIVDNETSKEVLVNKQRKLPDGYVPPDLMVPNVPFSFTGEDPRKQLRKEAAAALEELFAASEAAGLDLVAASGYRSYDRQKVIYDNNVARNGQENADKFSAKPGTSEHQTGLAMDVTSAEMAFALEQTFKQTAEGSWLAENAHKYGYIIRYLEGKEEITGYSYEPWHIRYVGKEIANEVYKQQLTLEEYFGFGY